jgi:hypothetical protein
MPKEGDLKTCVKCDCEDAAKYERVSSHAHSVEEGTVVPEPVNDQFAWFCASCGHEERVQVDL